MLSNLTKTVLLIVSEAKIRGHPTPYLQKNQKRGKPTESIDGGESGKGLDGVLHAMGGCATHRPRSQEGTVKAGTPGKRHVPYSRYEIVRPE